VDFRNTLVIMTSNLCQGEEYAARPGDDQNEARSLKEQEVGLEVSDEAVAWLAERGFDPVFGARPVKRVIQREVQDRVADLILSGGVGAEAVILVEAGGEGGLVARVRA
jgi:ATP-dependent Clp protease ATP-binding subunit ClpA